MDIDFIIPLKKEDLIKSREDCYSVNLAPFKDAIVGVRDLKFSIERNGCETIFKHFELCFSFLFATEDFSLSQLQEFYEEVIEVHLKKLCAFTEKAVNLDPTGKKKALNAIKMICYLFSLTLKTYEETIVHQNDNLIPDPKNNRRPNTKTKNKFENVWPWFDKKLEAVSTIYSFMKLPISNLWQSRIVEETLVNLIAGCCFKIFENSEINLVKSKSLKDSASQVLSLLVANYNYTFTFLPKSVEIMKQHEHSASAIANTVLIMHRNYNCQTILEKMLEELLDVLMEDPQTLGKPVASFLSDLGENNPEMFLPCEDILNEFLSVDAYFVRNAIMIIFCEMVVNCFSQEKLTDDLVKTRNGILKHLQTQINDENAFVRSKVVQLWTKLASSSHIPVNYYVPLLRDMRHRLLDKSIHVSKNAINFFTTALEHNPYGGKLRFCELNKEKELEMSKLIQLQDKQPLPPDKRWAIMEIEIVHSISEFFKDDKSKKRFEGEQDTSGVDIADVILIIASLINQKHYNEALSLLLSAETVYPESKEIRCNMEKTDEVAYYGASLKKIYLRAAELNLQSVVPDYYENINKMDSIQMVIKYLSDCINFIEYIDKGSDTIYKLMFSNNISEILEAIEFFSKAYKFQIRISEKAVRDMLLLVNSNTPELKNAVAKAYSSLYLETSKTNARVKAAQIAQRLINLVKGLDHDQKLALEELLQKWIESQQLDKEFILILFERVVQTPEGKTSISDCNASLILIDIVSEVNKSVVSGNLPYLKSLLDIKFSNHTITLVCSLLRKLGGSKKKNKPIRYRKDNEIFKLVSKIIIDKFSSTELEYMNMAKAVIDLIFHLCYKPEELANEILCKLYQQLIEDIDTDNLQNEIKDTKDVLESRLEKLLFVCGHIVFRKWQYCDKDVFNYLKKCQDGMIVEKQADESIDDFEMEADNVIAADDNLYELITYTCDNFLTTEDSLIHHIISLTVKVCHFPDEKISQALKASASLTLAKCMCISGSFCEQHFQLYVTLMDRCKHEAVRSNLVLGFGDLLSRFPNTAEPWTTYLYSRLKDHSELVRLNSVSVLCQLISREMIKVRGQFAELLLHMEDPQPIIAEKVNSLLLDLSIKGNTIYNVIPDIISKLSNPQRDNPVASSTFKLIIGRLFELITKERQNDLLVEKLCSRLKESTNEKQWEDLIYCLSQIRYSEKSLRKLTEALPSFNERLSHPPVHDTLLSIINTSMKSTKHSLKEIAQEASATLEELMTAKDDKETSPKTKNENNTPEGDKNSEEDDTINMKETGMETPLKPIPVNKETRRTARKAPKTPRVARKQPFSNDITTRSTRKKKTVIYDSTSD